jgi:uncharacterized membrane protein (UPF0127 family)
LLKNSRRLDPAPEFENAVINQRALLPFSKAVRVADESGMVRLGLSWRPFLNQGAGLLRRFEALEPDGDLRATDQPFF